MKADQLLKLSDDQFRKIVDTEVRKSTDKRHTPTADEKESWRELHDPRLHGRWVQTLTAMKKSVESQLGSKRADVEKMKGLVPESQYEELKRGYADWRATALRFKSGVEDRLIQVRGSETTPILEHVERERNRLRDAISTHRTKALADFDPTPIDEELWAVLDE